MLFLGDSWLCLEWCHKGVQCDVFFWVCYVGVAAEDKKMNERDVMRWGGSCRGGEEIGHRYHRVGLLWESIHWATGRILRRAHERSLVFGVLIFGNGADPKKAPVRSLVFSVLIFGNGADSKKVPV